MNWSSLLDASACIEYTRVLGQCVLAHAVRDGYCRTSVIESVRDGVVGFCRLVFFGVLGTLFSSK